MQISEKTPDTTSVIRCSAFVPDAKYCMSANDSARAQRARPDLRTPPSRCRPPSRTKVTTSQNGTSTDTNGSWRPAIADSVS